MSNKIAKTTTVITHNGEKLSARQSVFIDKYIEYGNASKAGLEAGYEPKCVGQTVANLLKNSKIKNEIIFRQKQRQKESIATGQQVMEFFTKVMNGEVKDQFGLESTLSDRLKAANELARRTVDIENKLNGKDNNEIKVVIERRK